MRYILAADAIMAFHFLFIAFALLGSFLVLWKRWMDLAAPAGAGLGRVHRALGQHLPAHAAREPFSRAGGPR